MFIKKSLINNWANAIVEVAVEEKKIEVFLEESMIIKQVFKENLEYKKLLSIHENSDDIREKLLDKVFQKKDFDELIINSLKLIVKRDLINHVEDILKEVIKRLNKISNNLYGTLWSAKEISDKDIKTIEEKLSKKYNTHVILKNKIDKKLIGGLKVLINNEYIDGTISGKLEDMKSKILDNKIGTRGD